MIRRAAIFLTLFISLLAGVLPAAGAMGGRNGTTGNILLMGALLTGESVKVNAQHSLSIASQQDSFSTHEQTKSSAYGFGGSVTSIHGAFTAELHASFGKTTEQLQGSTLTVNEQSGIFSGPGGYDIHVGKNTTLTGAVIATEGNGSNSRFNTGSLTLNDLTNSLDWRVGGESSNFSYGGSMSGGGGSPGGGSAASAWSTDSRGLVSGLASTVLGTGGVEDSGKDRSSTRSAIGAGDLVIREGQISVGSIHRDTAGAHGSALGALPDLRGRLDGLWETQALVNQASSTVANAAGDMADFFANQTAQGLAAQGQDPNGPNPWAEGGIYRNLLHAGSQGLVTEIAGGDALQSATGAYAGSEIGALTAAYLTKNGASWTTANVIAQGAATLGGYAVGGSTGAATAQNVDQFNRQLHRTELEKIKELAGKYAAENDLSLEEAFNILLSAAYGMVDGASEAINDRQREAYQEELAQAAAFLQANSGQGLFHATNAEKFDNRNEAALAELIRNTKSEKELQKLLLTHVAIRQSDILTGTWATGSELTRYENILNQYKDYNEAIRLGAFSTIVNHEGAGFWENSWFGNSLFGTDAEFTQMLGTAPDLLFGGLLRPSAEQASNSLFTGAGVSWVQGENTCKIEDLHTTTLYVRNGAIVSGAVVGGVIAAPVIGAAFSEASLYGSVYGASALTTLSETALLPKVVGVSMNLGQAATIAGTSWMFGTAGGHEFIGMMGSSGLTPQQTAMLLGFEELQGMWNAGKMTGFADDVLRYGNEVYDAARTPASFFGNTRLEVQALQRQGLSRSEAFQQIRSFNAGNADGYLFHFTTQKGARGIVGEGVINPSARGVWGPGVYSGATPTPGPFLKNVPFAGWGLGGKGANVRIPFQTTQPSVTPWLPPRTRVCRAS